MLSLLQAGCKITFFREKGAFTPFPGSEVSYTRMAMRRKPGGDRRRDSYVTAIIAFARNHRVKVVLPTSDVSIVTLAPHRERFAEFGFTLAMAPDAALKIANDRACTPLP
ncbi:MAG TPA: hypothetical protein VHZ03_21585 [Trebonia sp.]|nr:hypothetical protein [Trebonia sp.]